MSINILSKWARSAFNHCMKVLVGEYKPLGKEVN